MKAGSLSFGYKSLINKRSPHGSKRISQACHYFISKILYELFFQTFIITDPF